MTPRAIRSFGLLAGMAGAGALLFWLFGVCRVYVEPGEVLILSAKLGSTNPDPSVYTVVDRGVKGIQREVLGEGRHFYNPIQYDRDTASSVIDIGPLEVGVVKSMWGTPVAEGEFLAEPGQRGIHRQVLTPGRYRVNRYAYEVEKVPAVVIRPGYVGCVIAQSGVKPPEGALSRPGQRGIQRRVLQPGLYFLNPHAQRVIQVEVGYRHLEFTEVQFPSRDGFTIKMDTSVVWGLQPEDVPHVVNKFGNVDDVVEKIIKPQVQSICRIEGSKYGAREFIEGKTREEFQNAFTAELEKVCQQRNISILLALVRNIEIPEQVRIPIQQAKIAAEEQLTKKQQGETQKVLNDLEEIRADVVKGKREVDAQTEKLVANVQAEGKRRVAGIQADKDVAVATIEQAIAEVEAKRQLTMGKAEAAVRERRVRAEADRLKQLAGALGDAATYANYEFVRKLPDTFQLFFRYAGPGTLWTDIKGTVSPADLAAFKILQSRDAPAGPGTPGAGASP